VAPGPSEPGKRLFAYNGGFLNARVRRILALAGHRLTTGRPGDGDAVAVWGRSPTAHRGETMAARYGVPIVRVEDAFLRSLHPGRTGAPPMGLLLDRSGVHFDSSHPSDLETMLASAALDDTVLLDRARDVIDRLRRDHLTKYCAVDPDLPLPDPGYVLVVDQTRGDASITHGAGSEELFAEMLAFARIENPGARIVIKTHPETAQGFRDGHFSEKDKDGKTTLLDTPVSPWSLLEGAVAVYAVTSQMGFEAILAGHRPRVFGQPFYGGWGLTQDENPQPRRERKLTRAQLVAGALIEYPLWYDPHRDRLCEIEDTLDALAAEARAWREDRHGWIAGGMRLWKRGPLQQVFGRHRAMVFEPDPDRLVARSEGTGRRAMCWAGKLPPSLAAAGIHRLEDGLLRSRGLGADLVPPLSLVIDPEGIYYDPTRPSRLEQLIARSVELKPSEVERARRLIARLTAEGLTKYNIGTATLPDLPRDRHVILVPGQVADDASIRLGTDAVSDNTALLARTRAENPDAFLVYKPHPDVEAGLREGAVAADNADLVLAGTDAAALLRAVDAVWTMTSTVGFEALLRGVPVTCLGTPFYAGWGLTADLGRVPARRVARPNLAQLVHAVLIGYPRYHDPVTGTPCPVEVAVDRLAAGRALPRSPLNRLLAKAQGALASQAHLWR